MTMCSYESFSRYLSAVWKRFAWLMFVAVMWTIGSTALGPKAWAACSTAIGKATINEYNNLGSNNELGGSYVEIKLLPEPIGISSGQAPLSDTPGWTLKSYTKTGSLQDTKAVSSAGTGTCAGTNYRATPLALSGAGDGFIHLLDSAGNLVDALYLNVAVPSNAVSCTLSTISTDKDIQGSDSNRKNVSRAPDGTGDWIMSLGSGSNSEQTLCANNGDLLGVAKSASVSTVYVGETVTFSMTVSNRSRATTLSNVQLADTLPAGFSRTANSAPLGTTFDSTTNTWTIASMMPGQIFTLTLTVRADRVGNWINSAVASVIFSGQSYQSDASIASVAVLQPLSLTKSVSPSSVPFNTAATFTVTVTNNSSAVLPSAFTINDTVPAGLTAGTTVASSGSSYSGGVWTINSGMAAGASATLSLPVISQSTAATFTNTATAVAPFGGSNLSASAALTVSAVVAVSSFNAFESSTAAGAVVGVIKTKVAGSTFSLDVVAVSGGAQTGSFTNSVKVELLGNNVMGVALDANNCPTSSTVLQSVSPNPTITSGRSLVTFAGVANAWRDVRVKISYPVAASTSISCSTDNFAIRPNSLSVSATDTDWQTAGLARALNNIAANGGNVHKAGKAFTIQATGFNSIGAVTGNYVGSPVSQSLTCTLPTPSCVNGALVLGAWTATGGTVSNVTANYSEVGSFNLTLQDTDFAIVDAIDGTTADCAGRYVCGAPTTVGRFVPDHFAVSPNNVSQFKTFNSSTCATRSFTYIGQPFGFVTAPQVLVTARNASNTTTANYSGSLWKLAASTGAQDCTTNPDICTLTSGSVTQTYTYTTVPVVTPNWSGTQVVLATPTLTANSNGTGTLASASGDLLAFKRSASTPIAPFSASIILASNVKDASEAGNCGLAVCDITALTAASFSPIAFDAGNTFRYGRLVLSNAYGSELLNLPVPLSAQYWTGTFFATNTADSCSAIPVTSVTMGNYLKQLNACEAQLLPSGSVILQGGRAAGAGLLLTKPGLNNTGSVDLAINVGATPAGNTCVGPTASAAIAANLPWFGVNPGSRATFGVYKSPLIYSRENY